MRVGIHLLHLVVKLAITYCESRLTSRVHAGDDVIVGGDVNGRKHAIKMAAIFTTAVVLFFEYKSCTMSVHATSNPH